MATTVNTSITLKVFARTLSAVCSSSLTAITLAREESLSIAMYSRASVGKISLTTYHWGRCRIIGDVVAQITYLQPIRLSIFNAAEIAVIHCCTACYSISNFLSPVR